VAFVARVIVDVVAIEPPPLKASVPPLTLVLPV